MRYLLIVSLLIACGDDSSASDAGADGGSDAGRMDASLDASVDAGDDDAGSDAGEDDAGCTGETDAVLCVAVGATCGSISATDRCGEARTPECGDCVAPEACGVEEANQCANADWIITTVDDGGDRVDLAIDGSNDLHVAFRKDRELWYGVLADDAWTTEQIDDPILGGDVAIAIDGSGVVHVAATAGSTSPARTIDLWTLTDDWAQTLIDGLSVTSIDLVFDGDDAQLCGYHPPMGGFGGLLTHFAEGGAGFAGDTIDGSISSSESREGNYCSLAFDGANLHVGYHGGQFQRLEYAADSSGTWAVETVDAPAGDFAGEYVSLALDGSGNAVISYRALTIGDPEIRLARQNGGTWDIATVDDGAGVIANHTSLAIDGGDLAHMSYFDSDAPGTMRYARETASGFELSDVAVVGTGSGGFNAIGIDSTGVVHIVFLDASSGELKHATPR